MLDKHGQSRVSRGGSHATKSLAGRNRDINFYSKPEGKLLGNYCTLEGSEQRNNMICFALGKITQFVDS